MTAPQDLRETVRRRRRHHRDVPGPPAVAGVGGRGGARARGRAVRARAAAEDVLRPERAGAAGARR